ncbi:outer membrane beta-barrel protein [Vibrio superstes]|uniref:Outer membrane protein beta-barrel domain-containing protein n=1 Tax=Vibrio superstes NBRC 103154 TaxID=1219062 RepID=A0A511QMQ3_9VIBR|nr:outer membrane beta-barrel protein [Vibrio superstes]GEM78600.1 hypothetical protein VSU01S_08450 [Vibrio superstes NBRC 103154]GEM78602.1 hypothetical protein VSU01S_08470 [Vibrio superstes NBRC 103154]
MKNRLFASMLLLISSSSIAGMDHSGLRVGAGLASDMGMFKLEDKVTGFDSDPSVIVDLGYDFNDIFAINVTGAATGFKWDRGKQKPQYIDTAYEVAVAGEVGYTKVTERGFTIKPYVALGGVYYNKQANLLFTGNDGGSDVRGRGTIGLRVSIDNKLYLDGRVQATNVAYDGKLSGKEDLLTQGLVTIGYKF